MLAPNSSVRDRPSLRYRFGIWILLAVATMAAHGRSLGEGFWLDDHWHQVRIREIGWSFGELLGATTIEPHRLIGAWWQDQPVRWQYSRPAAVLLMKVVQGLSGGSPAAQHGVSLLLHFATACMVHQLCFLLTRHRFWSVVGGLFFVVYAHGIFTVPWLAAQNAVLQTALMLGAVLCYIHASGLDIGPRVATSDEVPPPLGRLAFLGAVGLWVIALFSRESAIIFPAIVLAFDWAFGGRRCVWRRRRAHLLLVLLALAYAIWRLVWYYHPMPSPYVRGFGDEGSLTFCAIKLLHYICSSIWQSPMMFGPTGRFDPLREVPGDCLLMLIIVTVLGTGFFIACRGVRGNWIGPLWLVLTVLPVVPIMATPQSGYPCGVPFAVAMILGPGLSRTMHRKGRGRISGPVALALLISTCLCVRVYRATWESLLAAERYTISEIGVDPPSNDVTDMFFLNLPFANVYVRDHLAEHLGDAMSDIRCHVLTYAPELLGMAQPCELTQRDAFSFSIKVAGRPYFSGLLGRYLIEAMRAHGPMNTGEIVRGDLFDVQIVRAEEAGVRELRFIFRQPLASEAYRFYLSTPYCGALRLTFVGPDDKREQSTPVEESRVILHNTASAAERLISGDWSAGDTLLATIEAGTKEERRGSWDSFRQVAGLIAGATGSSVQALLAHEEPPSELLVIRRWWRAAVDDHLINRVWCRRDDFAALRGTRARLFDIRSTTAGIIQTDLYLTGPPYPGPRSEEKHSDRSIPPGGGRRSN